MRKLLIGLCVLALAVPCAVPASAEEKFVMEEMLAPVWEGETSFCESVFVVEEEDGSVAPIRLLYDAEEIVSVRSMTLETVYEEGRDYRVEDGKLVIPAGSTVPRVTFGQFHPFSGTPGFEDREGGYVMFIEGIWYHLNQLAVTYRHAASYSGEVPAQKGGKLPRTLEKLKAGHPLKLVFSGDSITAGYNASGKLEAAPGLPAYPGLFAEGLRARYGSEIEVVNTAVGGMGVEWGLVNCEDNISAHAPDLVVLAFGMNDIRMPASDFRDKVRAIIADVRADCPDAEFLLVAAMLPNERALTFWGTQKEHGAALSELESSMEGVALADMGSMHASLLKRKRYADMTGNNVNHPNDYLMRVYAQTLLRTLEEPEPVPPEEAPKGCGSGCVGSAALLLGALALGAVIKWRSR